MNDCRLAAARAADQRQRLARVDTQRHAAQHRLVGPHLIRELHVAQLEFAAKLRAVDAHAGIHVNVGQRVEQRNHTLRSATRLRK
jgi:hypothetical protein